MLLLLIFCEKCQNSSRKQGAPYLFFPSSCPSSWHCEHPPIEFSVFTGVQGPDPASTADTSTQAYSFKRKRKVAKKAFGKLAAILLNEKRQVHFFTFPTAHFLMHLKSQFISGYWHLNHVFFLSVRGFFCLPPTNPHIPHLWNWTQNTFWFFFSDSQLETIGKQKKWKEGNNCLIIFTMSVLVCWY